MSFDNSIIFYLKDPLANFYLLDQQLLSTISHTLFSPFFPLYLTPIHSNLSIQESEKHFRELLENVHLPVLIPDVKGRITYCNPFSGCNHHYQRFRWSFNCRFVPLTNVKFGKKEIKSSDYILSLYEYL